MPFLLYDHSMVKLGNGQAILGGYASGYQNEIHFYTCMNLNCVITTLSQTLLIPRAGFVVIPIPDTYSGCISGGINLF